MLITEPWNIIPGQFHSKSHNLPPTTLRHSHPLLSFTSLQYLSSTPRMCTTYITIPVTNPVRSWLRLQYVKPVITVSVYTVYDSKSPPILSFLDPYTVMSILLLNTNNL